MWFYKHTCIFPYTFLYIPFLGARHSTSISPIKKQISEIPEKITKEKSVFSFQTLTEMFKPVTAIPETPKNEKVSKEGSICEVIE